MPLLLALALLLLASPLGAEVRAASFASAALGREVRYVVDLPPSYDSAQGRRYPVVYALHGLFEGPGFWEGRGLATILADLATFLTGNASVLVARRNALPADPPGDPAAPPPRLDDNSG